MAAVDHGAGKCLLIVIKLALDDVSPPEGVQDGALPEKVYETTSDGSRKCETIPAQTLIDALAICSSSGISRSLKVFQLPKSN